MKCTFYRPETIDFTKWNSIMLDMRADLNRIENCNVSEGDVVQCFLK